MILVFRMLSFKPTFSPFSFTFIKRLFSSSSLCVIRVVSSAYLRLLIFFPGILNVILNGLPWKRTEIILSFLRLHPGTAFWTLLLTMMATPFLLRSKHLLILWLQSSSAVILEPPKIKSVRNSGNLHARILEWVAFSFSKVSFQPRDRTQVSHISGGFFTS